MGWFSKEHKVKKGDIVVCIDDRGWNGQTSIILTYRKKYKVLDVLLGCHGYCYDIGGKFMGTSQLFTVCGTCSGTIPGSGIHWAGAFRFTKATDEEVKEYNKEQEKNIKHNLDKALETEDYELAEKLKKELEKIF